MLNFYIGHLDNEVIKIDSRFKAQFKRINLLTDFSRRVVAGVDKSEVHSENIIISPVLGYVTPLELSGGVKLLLLLMYNDIITEFNYFGENCYKYIAEIARVKDVTLCVTQSVYRFFELSGVDKVRVVNVDTVYYDEASMNKSIRKYIKENSLFR